VGRSKPKVANPAHVKALLYLRGNYGNVGDNAAHAARLSRAASMC
jgi:hypothetical protein